MRLASLVMVALLAGCVGPFQVNDAPKADGSTTMEETRSAVESERSEQGADGSPDPGERQDEPRPGPAEDGSDRQVPPALHWEGTFTVGADAGATTDTPCGALSSCDYRSFSIDGTFDLEATLSWGLAANDFDLYLFIQDGAEVSRDGNDEMGDIPSTSQVLVHEGLAPGHYELWVVGSRMVMDSYELDAVFTLPRGPAPGPPAPMHWEGGMGMVALPAAGPWSECGVPLTGCDGPFFTTDGTFDLEATLSWDLPTNDLDLHLCRWRDRQCDEVSRDGINDIADQPHTRQVLRHADLPPGHYRLWIVPQHGVSIEYELDAVFRAVRT